MILSHRESLNNPVVYVQQQELLCLSWNKPMTNCAQGCFFQWCPADDMHITLYPLVSHVNEVETVYLWVQDIYILLLSFCATATLTGSACSLSCLQIFSKVKKFKGLCKLVKLAWMVCFNTMLRTYNTFWMLFFEESVIVPKMGNL